MASSGPPSQPADRAGGRGTRRGPPSQAAAVEEGSDQWREDVDRLAAQRLQGGRLPSAARCCSQITSVRRTRFPRADTDSMNKSAISGCRLTPFRHQCRQTLPTFRYFGQCLSSVRQLAGTLANPAKPVVVHIENRYWCKPIGGSNPSPSANSKFWEPVSEGVSGRGSFGDRLAKENAVTKAVRTATISVAITRSRNQSATAAITRMATVQAVATFLSRPPFDSMEGAGALGSLSSCSRSSAASRCLWYSAKV